MVGPSDIRNIPNKILGNFHSHLHARTLKRNERFEPRRAAAWKKGEMECFYDFLQKNILVRIYCTAKQSRNGNY